MIQDGIHTENQKITSILMIGQSNMAGRGDFGQVPEIQNDRCYMLRMGRWQKMSEPINPDRSILTGEFHSGVGLAASFANSFANTLQKDVGLIPCADGGTRIEQWLPGELLYDHAVVMTKLAMRSSKFGGIIWHQGESNCHVGDEISDFKDKFVFLVESLRKDLDCADLPFIAGEVCEHIRLAHSAASAELLQTVNQIYHSLEGVLPRYAVVSAKDLNLKPDGIHFDSASYRIFGERYFNTYLKAR